MSKKIEGSLTLIFQMETLKHLEFLTHNKYALWNADVKEFLKNWD
jgi:hypothetical protein